MRMINDQSLLQSIETEKIILSTKEIDANKEGIHKLSCVGDIGYIKEILSKIDSQEAKKEYINKYNEHGVTALHSSIFHSQTENVKYLLSLGADPTLLVCGKTTSVHLAAAFADGVVVKRLLIAGGSVDGLDWTGKTPLDIAEMNGNKSVISVLKAELGKENIIVSPTDSTETPPDNISK